MSEPDEINKELLRLLGKNSRAQFSELREMLAKKGHKLTREAVEYRVKKMTEKGIIERFAMLTSPEKIGYHISCHISINVKDPKKKDAVGDMLAELPNTSHVYAGTNDFDITCRIFFKDTTDMLEFLDVLEGDGRIKDFNVDIVRKTYKAGPAVFL